MHWLRTVLPTLVVAFQLASALPTAAESALQRDGESPQDRTITELSLDGPSESWWNLTVTDTLSEVPWQELTLTEISNGTQHHPIQARGIGPTITEIKEWEIAFIDPGKKSEFWEIYEDSNDHWSYRHLMSKSGSYELSTKGLAVCHSLVITNGRCALMAHMTPAFCETLALNDGEGHAQGVPHPDNRNGDTNTQKAQLAIAQLKSILASKLSKLPGASIHIIHGPYVGPQGQRRTLTERKLTALVRAAGYTGQVVPHQTNVADVLPVGTPGLLEEPYQTLLYESMRTVNIRQIYAGQPLQLFVEGNAV